MMPKSTKFHPRQFTMMAPGIILGNWEIEGEWETVGNAAFSGPGAEYHFQAQLDLRGLLAGDETGISLSTVNLQEFGPWAIATPEYKGWFLTFDFLTTVRPNDEFLATIWTQPSLPGYFPGALESLPATGSPDKQDFNPSQLVWGMWRLWGVDAINTIGTNSNVEVMQSGMIGEGETVVAPGLWWTRYIVTYQVEDAVVVPSTNLVLRGGAVDLTTAQEVTQMMRASQR